jgi:hypothetical protein
MIFNNADVKPALFSLSLYVVSGRMVFRNPFSDNVIGSVPPAYNDFTTAIFFRRLTASDIYSPIRLTCTANMCRFLSGRSYHKN